MCTCVRGRVCENSVLCEGPLSFFIGRRRASPCTVPLPPASGRVHGEIPVIKLARPGRHEQTDCSDLGAQSIHSPAACQMDCGLLPIDLWLWGDALQKAGHICRHRAQWHQERAQQPLICPAWARCSCLTIAREAQGGGRLEAVQGRG